MPEKKTKRALLAAGMLVFIAGMALAAVWDLPLNMALHNPVWLPAILMETHGFYPMYLPVALWLVYAAQVPVPGGKPRAARLGLYALAGAVLAVLAYMGLHGLQKRAVAHAVLLNSVIWALLLLGIAALLLCCRRWTVQLEFVMRWATVYMLLNNVIINLLKLLWNRTRYDEMLAAGGTFDAFTSWLKPFGNGGTSFPSGHTAAACSIFVLVLLCDVLPAFARRRTLIWGLCWGYIAGMAAARIIIGRHYLSDTLMAAFVMTVLFFAMTHTRLYRQGVQWARGQ